MTLTEKIKSIYSGWFRSDFNETIATFTPTFWPFTTIAIFIYLQYNMAEKVTNTCSNTSISLIGVAPIQIANFICSLWFGLVGATMISIVLFVIKGLIGVIVDLFTSNKSLNISKENYNYVIPNTVTGLSRLERKLTYYFKQTLHWLLTEPVAFSMESGLLCIVFAIAGWFLPVNDCLNTFGKQLAKLGDLATFLIASGVIIYIINRFSVFNKILKKLLFADYKSFSDYEFNTEINIRNNIKIPEYQLFNETIENILKNNKDFSIRVQSDKYVSVINNTTLYSIELTDNCVILSKDNEKIYIKYDKFDNITHIEAEIAILFGDMVKEVTASIELERSLLLNEPEYSNPDTEDNNS